MFGHHDDKAEPQGNQENTVVEENQTPPNEGSEQEQLDEQQAEPAEQADAPVADDDKESNDTDRPDETAGSDDWQHPGTPLEDDKEKIRDVISPAGGFPKHPGEYPVLLSSGAPGLQPGNGENEELVGVRKQALDELTPLVDKLDLPPDDKFRTLMMLIQSSDNQDLVRQAYEAAHSIEDEKARAQALYDIISEINYFTGPPQDQTVTD